MLFLLLENQKRNQKLNSDLLRHAIDLLGTKDPLAYQVVATSESPVVSYDPGDDAEILRLRERGLDDYAIYDDVESDNSEYELIKREVGTI